MKTLVWAVVIATALPAHADKLSEQLAKNCMIRSKSGKYATNDMACLARKLLESVDRLERRVYDLQTKVQGVDSDRRAAISHASCNESCASQFGNFGVQWKEQKGCVTDEENQSDDKPMCSSSIIQREKDRRACYDACEKSNPFPVALGGGC